MTQSGDIKDTEEEVRRRRSSKGVGEGVACERNNAAGGENEKIEEFFFFENIKQPNEGGRIQQIGI